MPRKAKKKTALKKRNLTAKFAPAKAAGPMKDKRKRSRQQQKVEDRTVDGANES